MKKTSIIFLVILTILACNGKKDDTPVVARVDNITLTVQELKNIYPENVIYQLSDSDLQKLLEEWTNTQVLFLEAKRRKIDQEDSIKIYLDLLKKTTLAQTLIMREVEKVRVTPNEAKDYFNKYKDDFLYAVKIIQIVVPTEIEAQEIMDEIKSGANFERLAETKSPRKIEPRYWKREELPPRFGEKIYRIKTGEITGVVKEDISRNFLIGKLIDKKKIKSKVSFSEISDYIYNLLKFYKQSALYDSLTSKLKKDRTVELHPENIR